MDSNNNIQPLAFPPKPTLKRGVRIYEHINADKYEENHNQNQYPLLYTLTETNFSIQEDDPEPRIFSYHDEKYQWADDLLELQEKKRILLKKIEQDTYNKIARKKLKESIMPIQQSRAQV
jgi:hypothetical protein